MIHVEFAVPIRASRASAWELLRERVEEPERFVAQVVGCEVVERGEDELVRRVTFEDGVAVTERVSLLPERELVFRFVDHPKFEGEIRNLLLQVGDALWLSVYFRGRARAGVELDDGEIEQLREGVARTVHTAAELIEERGRAAASPGSPASPSNSIAGQ